VRFLDTNVLLYAISQDSREQDKSERANDLLAAGGVALSVQVLQELYVQATLASRPDPLTHAQAAAFVESEVRTAVMLAALATRDRFQLSYWDAAIVEACRSLGCDVVLSEDLADGQHYDGVRVENPFRRT
jgi:predicted nucleic acid-binding protein